MATDGAANRHNSVAYTAQQERRMAAVRSMPGPASEVFSGRSGRRVNGAGLGVTVDSTGAGTYTVTAGAGTIYDSTYATQGGWDFEIDTALSAVALPARPGAGTSRIDLIVARIYDVDISVGAVREVKIERVGGTAAASPTAPALPALSLRLTTLTVPNSGTISVSANTAVTVAAGGILPVATTTERDALVSVGIAYKGLVVDNAQTGFLERYITGTTWKQLREVKYSDQGLTAVTPTGSGWSNIAEGCSYTRQSDWVHVTVGAQKGTYGVDETIFNLPVGFRPLVDSRISGSFNATSRYARVLFNGNVVTDAASTGGIVGSISFPAA